MNLHYVFIQLRDEEVDLSAIAQYCGTLYMKLSCHTSAFLILKADRHICLYYIKDKNKTVGKLTFLPLIDWITHIQ